MSLIIFSLPPYLLLRTFSKKKLLHMLLDLCCQNIFRCLRNGDMLELVQKVIFIYSVVVTTLICSYNYLLGHKINLLLREVL